MHNVVGVHGAYNNYMCISDNLSADSCATYATGWCSNNTDSTN